MKMPIAHISAAAKAKSGNKVPRADSQESFLFMVIHH